MKIFLSIMQKLFSFTPSPTDTPNTSADRGARAVWVPQYKKRNACVFILFYSWRASVNHISTKIPG